MTNPLIPFLIAIMPYSTINTTPDILRAPPQITQNMPKKGLSEKEKEFLWAIKQRHEYIYKTGNDSTPLCDRLKEINEEIPEINFMGSSASQAKEYFYKLGYFYYEEFGVNKTRRLIPSIYIAEIKEQGRKKISLENRNISLDYILTEYPLIDLYTNFNGINKICWYDNGEDKFCINKGGLEIFLKSMEQDTSISGRLFRQQKEISKDSLGEDYLQSILTHEAAHKNDNYSHDLTGQEIYAYLNELVYGKTRKGTLANILGLRNSPIPEYKTASDYIIKKMLELAGGKNDSDMELWSGHEIKLLAKKALSRYISTLPSKN